MESLVVGGQKLNSFSSWAVVDSGQVGESSYIYKKGEHPNIYKKVSRKKSTSERLAIKYKTKDKIVRFLNDVGEDRKAQSMALCGQKFDVLTCGQHIVAETPNHRCNIRYCALCSGRRANKYRKKYLPYALAFEQLSPVKLTPCLLTLTQKKIKGEKLKDSRERILKSFRKFIRHNFFVDYFDGGIFTVENTVSDDGNHCHIHCVVFRKKFINHRLLKSHWSKVSEGAENLNIKLIDDLERGLAECIKYVSKPLDVDKFERKHLLELLEIRGKRMIDTFGGFRDFCKAHELPKQEEVKEKEKERLEEGNPCWKCNDNDGLLFHVSMTASEKIRFHQQMEQVRGSPPITLGC
jgi:hypothetical protein